MQLCFGVKTLQSGVSVICQISYLVSNSNLNDPTTSPQAKALFGLNIAVSLTSFVMGLVMLLLKGSLMRSVKGKDAESSNKEIEMSMDMVYTDNPLQNVGDSKDATNNFETHSRVYELETEIADVMTKNTDLMTENIDQKTEISNLKAECTILQERIKELESKVEDNNDKSKNVDL
jgi:peptidoglycan hydrolase CwlO-like protein